MFIDCAQSFHGQKFAQKRPDITRRRRLLIRRKCIFENTLKTRVVFYKRIAGISTSSNPRERYYIIIIILIDQMKKRENNRCHEITKLQRV